MSERLVVIGADPAGMSAASQARKRRGPDDLEIVAFERGHFTSYSACGIPYFISDTVTDIDSLIMRSPEVFRDKYSIDVRLRFEVTQIDLDARKVIAHSLEDGTVVQEGFDQLVLGTGAVPLRPDLQNADAHGIFGVQVLDHGVAIKEFIDRESPKRAVVVGAGYVGIEMAEALSVLGMEVTVVERAAQPMTTLDPDMGELVADAMRELKIDVRTEESVGAFDASDGRVTAVITESGPIEADIVVLGLGVRPNTDLAVDAGIATGPSGAIAVDRRMRTSSEGVWAAGDCAEKWHRVARKPVAVPLGTHANKEGRVCGINIGGGYATFPGIVGTAASKVCDLEVARTGLKESEAKAAGYEYLVSEIDSRTRAIYFPGAARMRTKLVVEKRSGLLLGGQIVGREGAAKRIDVIATALWNEMTVAEMLNLDLSYAPPFAPVWDPVLIAARKAWQRVEETVTESG